MVRSVSPIALIVIILVALSCYSRSPRDQLLTVAHNCGQEEFWPGTKHHVPVTPFSFSKEELSEWKNRDAKIGFDIGEGTIDRMFVTFNDEGTEIEEVFIL